MHYISYELETLFLETSLSSGHWCVLVSDGPRAHQMGVEVGRFFALVPHAGKPQPF